MKYVNDIGLFIKNKEPLKDLKPDPSLDWIIWCNFGGNELAVVNKRTHGAKDLTKKPNFPIYQFVKRVVPTLFNPNTNKDRVAAMMTRVTNQMSELDNDVVYKALAGKVDFNRQDITEYCGERTILINGKEYPILHRRKRFQQRESTKKRAEEKAKKLELDKESKSVDKN